MTPQASIAAFLCVALFLHPIPLAAAQAEAAAQTASASGSNKMGAAQLVKSADRAVSFIVKAGRESSDPALNPDKKESEPFWRGVKNLNEAVSKVDRGLFLKDETFFTSLGEANAAMEEVKISFSMSGAKDAKVIEGVEKADRALSLLRENYSKEAVRLKKGGELSAAERKKFNEIKDKQADLQRKLTELEGKVGKNKTMLDGVRKLQKESKRVQHCHNDLNGFMFAMSAMNMISGLIWGWHSWWGPWGGWGPSFFFGYTEIYVDVINVIDIDYDWDLMDDLAVDLADYEDLELSDLDVDIDDVEAGTMDEFLDEGDFEVTDMEAEDLSAEPLDFEGEMDVIDSDSFDEPDFGDFDDDVGFDDFDDFGGFDDFGDF